MGSAGESGGWFGEDLPLDRKGAWKKKNMRTWFKIDKLTLPAKPKISFCTTCMGRLHHLKETLPRNIEDNKDYPDLEFVLLDYSSPDGMYDWVQNNFKPLLDSGRIRYYRVEGCTDFHMTHAKNIAHRLACGDIVCNVDADNFTGKGFAEFLETSFRKNHRRVVHGDWRLCKGSNGRLALLREYFLFIGGYNEKIKGWGYDDTDLIDRLRFFGLEDLVISNMDFLKTIQHDRDEAWTITQKRNMELSQSSLEKRKFRANRGELSGRRSGID